MFNESFYPTPPGLILKMLAKIDWKKASHICEPSAGSGKIIEQMRESKGRHYRLNIHAIEKDDDLRNMLIGAGEKVIGKDFLTYAGLIQFDTIIMNPPFSNGEAHLLKAIEILYSGQIVCLLNAETLKNPCSNKKKELFDKLTELNAEVEFIENAFLDAERKTAVEVALITIKIEREVEDDLFDGVKDRVKEYDPGTVDEQIKDIANSDTIEAIVDDYNDRASKGIKTIQEFYRNHKYIGSYFSLKIYEKGQQNDRDYSNYETLTDELKDKTNKFLASIRHHYWNKTMSLPAFEKRLTEKKQTEFRETLKKNSDLEFTTANVRAFFENIMGSYEATLIDAIETLFDEMTAKYAYDDSIHCKNTHYYNGWKTNDAFKINKKVILPRVGIDPYSYSNHYDVGYQSKRKLDDIDKVMNYFEGKSSYRKITDAAGEKEDILQILESEFFLIRFYKKGTTHLTFKSDDIRRRFNIEVGKRKGWLPMDYGNTPLKQLTTEEREVVKSFEDNVKDYSENLYRIGLAKQPDMLAIAS